MDLFSHPAPASPPVTESTGARTPVYVETDLPLEELWLAFTEYTHLWWHRDYRKGEGSYLEFSEKFLTEDTDDGQQHILAETEHFAPGDVIAVSPLPGQLDGAFEQGVSFVFDREGEKSLVDICSGIIRPRDFSDDSELGVFAADLPAACKILGAFARFVQAELVVEAE